MLSAAPVPPPEPPAPEQLEELTHLATSLAAHPHGTFLVLALLTTWLLVWLCVPRKPPGSRRQHRDWPDDPAHPHLHARDGP